MIRSVAAQLECEASLPCLSPTLEHLYSTCCGSGRSREPTLDEALSLLSSYSVNASNTYIVLDALDECKDRVNIITAIKTLKEAASYIKLFVTSRREADLVEGLTKDFSQGLPIEGDALIDDIRIYVNSVLRLDPLLVKLPEHLKTHVEHVLVEGS